MNKKQSNIQHIKLSLLGMNSGQIEGVPKNPRILKDNKFDKLKQSILDDPEMLSLREMIVYQQNEKNIVICGNMRLKALKELIIPFDHVEKFKAVDSIKLNSDNTKIASIDVKIAPDWLDAKKLRAIAIKDNNSFGEWDFELLANEWELPELQDWGMDALPDFSVGDEKELDESIADDVKYNECPECGHKWAQ